MWEKGEDVDKIVYTCVVDKIQEKKKKKKGKGNVWRKKKKGKVLEITISKYYHNIFIVFSQ